MSHKAVLTREAENDLSEIFEWYERRRRGLGFDFLLQVDAGLRLLEDDPQLFSEQYKGVRRYLVKRFPYKVFYRVKGKSIVVLAVVHGGRDPGWVKKRISVR
jgi:plasmid stabilization system protein ParE